MQTALEDANINLDAASQETSNAIEKALSDAWGATSLVSCSSGDMYEVWTCIDKNFQIFDCPSSVSVRACPRSVDIPGGDAVPKSCSPYFTSSSTEGGSSGALVESRKSLIEILLLIATLVVLHVYMNGL